MSRSDRMIVVWVALVMAVFSVMIAAVILLRTEARTTTPSQVTTRTVLDPRLGAVPVRRGRGQVAAPRWAIEVADATGIPVPAVRGYGTATLRLTVEQPDCRLGWTTLAAVGQMESAHGTSGGRTLRADGRSSMPVIGPALDGGPGVAAIRSTTASAAWHGDRKWDHAIGPMQFLPSSWERWGADGDDDGTTDPLDLDDAAYATARYLCAGERDLSTGPDWDAAILSYNHSRDYVTEVYDAAVAYAAATSAG